MQLLDVEQLATIVTLEEFEIEARARLTTMAYEYLAGGAGAGLTAVENITAFNRIRLQPRVLVDASHIDTTVKLFGRDYLYPILLAPTGYHKLFHYHGEMETVKGANQSETTLVSATFSNYTIEEIAGAAQRPAWFQLYIQTDRGFTKELVNRALAAGVEAICLTVDVPVNGPRDRELKAGFNLPSGVQRANLASLGSAISAGSHRPAGRNIYSTTHGADSTWADIDWLRSVIPVKLLLKGILHPADAELAVKAGCDGIMVSNHGGRSLDTVQPSIEALPAIVQRVAGRVPLLLDGGIRRGIDIFKALALGATAVLVGRPYIFGLAAGGANGIARVMEILRTELQMTMGLAGCTSIGQIMPEFVLNANVTA